MEENIDILIQKIQEARNPKYFLWNIIKNVEFFVAKYNSNILIGKKDGVIYFNYDEKNHVLYYSYDKIYQILSSKYHLNVLKANELVMDMVSKHFKLRVDTTTEHRSMRWFLVNKHFK
jgi:basic membrane lipoprotein Med (substrate-binding protein (PBP1-ABC) superfamily)